MHVRENRANRLPVNRLRLLDVLFAQAERVAANDRQLIAILQRQRTVRLEQLHAIDRRREYFRRRTTRFGRLFFCGVSRPGPDRGEHQQSEQQRPCAI